MFTGYSNYNEYNNAIEKHKRFLMMYVNNLLRTIFLIVINEYIHIDRYTGSIVDIAIYMYLNIFLFFIKNNFLSKLHQISPCL